MQVILKFRPFLWSSISSLLLEDTSRPQRQEEEALTLSGSLVTRMGFAVGRLGLESHLCFRAPSQPQSFLISKMPGSENWLETHTMCLGFK